jgi:molybdopterin-guanine dinucleotide biosynthesis protein A
MSSSHKTVVILAGGKATRFNGQDKGEILINGQRLIDIIHDRLKPQSAEIIISGTHNYGLDFPVIADAADAPRGPVGGIYSLWKYLESRDVEGFYTVPVDGPNLPPKLLARLYSADRSRIAVDAKGRHPTFAWWRMEDLAPIWATTDRSQSISLNRLADLVGAKEVEWSSHDYFLNINRQSDLDEVIQGL